MDNNFANNLKHLRIQAGMTQEELAKKMNKDYSAIGKWELGQRSPVMADVIKLAEIFNVPLNTLITDDFTKMNEKEYNELDLLYDETKGILNDTEKDVIKTVMKNAKEKHKKN